MVFDTAIYVITAYGMVAGRFVMLFRLDRILF